MLDSFYARAEQSLQMTLARFRVAGTPYFYEHVAAKETDRKVCELWPYSGLVSAYNALAAHPRFGERYAAGLAEVLAGMEAYYDASAPLPAYDSYILADGGATKYYDDNEWLGIEFVRAYRTLKDPRYLVKARAMFAYSVSGWSEAMGGGIFWRENDPDTKNTCSNGPAAVLALMLYQETREADYLDWAVRILDWLRGLKAPRTGVYLDALKADCSLDERTFTYNTGTPLHAEALLYQITRENNHLSEAAGLAQSAYLHFAAPVAANGQRILPNTPWFNAVLLRGYIELYRVDPAHDPVYLRFFKANLEHAWAHARAADGSFSPDWSGATELNEPVRWLLDQAAMVELYATMDEFTELA
jgi:hypothetical protein